MQTFRYYDQYLSMIVSFNVILEPKTNTQLTIGVLTVNYYRAVAGSPDTLSACLF